MADLRRRDLGLRGEAPCVPGNTVAVMFLGPGADHVVPRRGSDVMRAHAAP